MGTDDVAGTPGASADYPTPPLQLPLENPTEHPPGERLAALADESASPHELRHLAACPACAADVEGYRSLLSLARAERDRLGEPLSTWAPLEAAMRNEGLITSRPGLRAGGVPRIPAWMRNAAAAAVLVAGGVVAGRASTRGGPSVAPTNPVPLVRQDLGTEQKPADPGVATPVVYNNRDDAINAVLKAETAYRHAVAYLMVADSADRGDGIPYDYRTRLAVLDEVAKTTRAALFAAPNDQVLKSFYQNSVDARDATMRQLGHTVSASNSQVGKY